MTYLTLRGKPLESKKPAVLAFLGLLVGRGYTLKADQEQPLSPAALAPGEFKIGEGRVPTDDWEEVFVYVGVKDEDKDDIEFLNRFVDGRKKEGWFDEDEDQEEEQEVEP